MSVNSDEIKKIAYLAKLKVEPDQADAVASDLNNILSLVDQLQQAATEAVEPMANPLDAQQRLRADEVTELNQRDAFQAIAPAAEDGMYLVPKVID